MFLALGAVITALGLNAIFQWFELPGGLLWWVSGLEIACGIILAIRMRLTERPRSVE
jgi:hypothetical protein